jgi:hypothetical protein
MRIRISFFFILASALLAVACGGVETDPTVQEISAPLAVAPLSVLELDLPGCACGGEASPGSVQVMADDIVLRHPTDGNLQVVARGDGFICVGFQMNSFLGLDVDPGPGSGGGSHVQAGPSGGDGSGGLVADDPIPIINEFQGTVTENSDSH